MKKLDSNLKKPVEKVVLEKLLQSSNTFLLVTRNNPQKTIKDEEITQHIESGVDTLCQIVGTWSSTFRSILSLLVLDRIVLFIKIVF